MGSGIPIPAPIPGQIGNQGGTGIRDLSLCAGGAWLMGVLVLSCIVALMPAAGFRLLASLPQSSPAQAGQCEGAPAEWAWMILRDSRLDAAAAWSQPPKEQPHRPQETSP
jgi:hypothetical protein